MEWGRGANKGQGAGRKIVDGAGIRRPFHVLRHREERFSGGGSGPSVSRVAVAKGRAPDQGPGNIFLALP